MKKHYGRAFGGKDSLTLLYALRNFKPYPSTSISLPPAISFWLQRRGSPSLESIVRSWMSFFYEKDSDRGNYFEAERKQALFPLR
jgi:hypothetical protein